jgi:hypothetical protein
MAKNYRMGATGQPMVSVALETREFNNFIGQFLAKLDEPRQDLGLRKIAFDAVRLIMEKNPVDTGRSRAGWLVGLNTIAASLGGSRTARAPRGDAESQGYAKGSVAMNLRGTTKSIAITNSVAYIQPLEYGYSDKAPYGMVRITLQFMQRKLVAEISAELTALWQAQAVKMFSHFRSAAIPGGNVGTLAFSSRQALGV